MGDKYFFDCTNALFEKILPSSVKRALQAPSLSSFMFSNCDKEPQIRANSQREPVSDALERHHATGGRCCDALQNLSDRLLQTKAASTEIATEWKSARQRWSVEPNTCSPRLSISTPSSRPLLSFSSFSCSVLIDAKITASPCCLFMLSALALLLTGFCYARLWFILFLLLQSIHRQLCMKSFDIMAYSSYGKSPYQLCCTKSINNK